MRGPLGVRCLSQGLFPDRELIFRLREELRRETPSRSSIVYGQVIERFREINRQDDTGQQPHFVRARLTPADGRAHLVSINDVHLGHKAALRSKMESYVQFILDTDGVYALGLGDVIENATRDSVGAGQFEESFHLDKQIEVAIDILKPLAKAGKLLGLHRGNHEARSYNRLGIDPMRIVARELDVPYLGEAAYHVWRVGNQTYTCYSVHGRSGSRTPAGKLNALLRLRDVADADLYLMAHMHDRLFYEDAPYEIDENGPTPRYRTYVLAGSLLSYFQTYAETAALPPVRQAWVMITLHAATHRIDVTL